MTPQEAINILDQALAQVQANRKTHEVLIEALRTMQAAVAESQAPSNITRAEFKKQLPENISEP